MNKELNRESSDMVDEVNNEVNRVNYVELSNVTGLSTRHISRILKGRVKKPGHDTIIKLSNAMGLDPDELLDKIQLENQNGDRDKRYNGGRSLTEEKIQDILRCRGIKGMTTRVCANLYGVSRQTVSNIWTSEE